MQGSEAWELITDKLLTEKDVKVAFDSFPIPIQKTIGDYRRLSVWRCHLLTNRMWYDKIYRKQFIESFKVVSDRRDKWIQSEEYKVEEAKKTAVSMPDNIRSKIRLKVE